MKCAFKLKKQHKNKQKQQAKKQTTIHTKHDLQESVNKRNETKKKERKKETGHKAAFKFYLPHG